MTSKRTIKDLGDSKGPIQKSNDSLHKLVCFSSPSSNSCCKPSSSVSFVDKDNLAEISAMFAQLVAQCFCLGKENFAAGSRWLSSSTHKMWTSLSKAENPKMLRWKKESILIQRLLFNASKWPKVIILADSESNSNQRYFVIRACVNPNKRDCKTLHLHPTVGMRMFGQKSHKIVVNGNTQPRQSARDVSRGRNRRESSHLGVPFL